VNVPTLVVQGESDPFGTPPEGLSHTCPHPEHTLAEEQHTVAAVVSKWLAQLDLGAQERIGEITVRAGRTI
jgi:predicted alpha/beta-hydrolase family hydrolase